jgi:hypothetical protein
MSQMMTKLPREMAPAAKVASAKLQTLSRQLSQPEGWLGCTWYVHTRPSFRPVPCDAFAVFLNGMESQVSDYISLGKVRVVNLTGFYGVVVTTSLGLVSTKVNSVCEIEHAIFEKMGFKTEQTKFRASAAGSAKSGNRGITAKGE